MLTDLLAKFIKARRLPLTPPESVENFADGERIRVELMNKCNLHIVLRLPTEIFYAKSIKTNVLFFTRGKNDTVNTREIWFYDLRTNMPSFGVTNPFRRGHFADKKNSFDFGLIRDDSLVDYDELPASIEFGEDAIDNLQDAVDLLQGVVNKLRTLEGRR